MKAPTIQRTSLSRGQSAQARNGPPSRSSRLAVVFIPPTLARPFPPLQGVDERTVRFLAAPAAEPDKWPPYAHIWPTLRTRAETARLNQEVC